MSLLVLLDGPASGKAALVETDEVLSSAVAVLVQASGALAEIGDSLAATGVAIVGCTAALTEASDSVAAAGAVLVQESGAESESADLISAAAIVLISGNASTTEADDALQAGAAAPLAQVATPYPVSTRRRSRWGEDYKFLNPEIHRERIGLRIEEEESAKRVAVAEARIEAKKPGPGYADALEVLLGSPKLRTPVSSAPAALPAAKDTELLQQEVEELRELIHLEMQKRDEEDLLLLLAASVVHHGPPARTVIPR